MKPIRLLAFYFGLLALLAMFACERSQAQNAGNTGTQTTSVRLLNASTTTGRTVVPPANMIGQSASFFTYCTTATSLQLIVEESADGVSGHYTQISSSGGVPNGENGNKCSVIQVGGFYQYLAINVLAISGGNVSVWYSATSGPINIYPPATNSLGATPPIICDQTTTLAINNSTSNVVIAGITNKVIYVCGAIFSFQTEPAAESAGLIMNDHAHGSSCTGATGNIVFTLDTGTTDPLIIPANFGGNSVLTAQPGYDFCVSNFSGSNGRVTVSFAQN